MKPLLQVKVKLKEACCDRCYGFHFPYGQHGLSCWRKNHACNRKSKSGQGAIYHLYCIRRSENAGRHPQSYADGKNKLSIKIVQRGPRFDYFCDDEPTTGGVSASFASLGDYNFAEPGALIGFAGRRIIEQTIREELPEDFQTAEFLLKHGQLDAVIHRAEMKETLGRILALHSTGGEREWLEN